MFEQFTQHGPTTREVALALINRQRQTLEKITGIEQFDNYKENQEKYIPVFVARITQAKPLLKAQRDKLSTQQETDLFYRFYHQSFKVYYLQDWVAGSILALAEILPELCLNYRYLAIALEALKEPFDLSKNAEWDRHTRPLLEATYHTKTFLDTTLAIADKGETEVPQVIDPDFATSLYLWNLR